MTVTLHHCFFCAAELASTTEDISGLCLSCLRATREGRRWCPLCEDWVEAKDFGGWCLDCAKWYKERAEAVIREITSRT